MLCVHFTSKDVFVSFSADQSSDQLSEDPGFTFLYVCASVLSGVSVKCFQHTFAVLLNVCMYFVMFVLIFVFMSRMITLKVLNSIVLLGTSCTFVKEANMEEKLFDPPPSAVSSRVNSRANRTKPVHTAPQKGSN